MNIKIKGKNINIRTGGYDLKNKNKALLLIHGAGMDGSIWQLQTRYLASKGIRTLAVDLPGHGFSDSPYLKTIEQMSDRCLQLLNYLNIKSAVIVGHSMGSLITLEMAKKENKIIKAISLLGTSHIMPVHPDLITASENDLVMASSLMVDWSLSKKQHLGDHPAPGYWMIGSSIRLIQNSPKGTLANDLKACNNYKNASDSAKNISQKVQIISGAEDKMTPQKNAITLAENFDNVNLRVIQGTGHMLMIEKPNIITKELYNFTISNLII